MFNNLALDTEGEIWHYDIDVIKLVCDIEDATGRVILSLYDIETASVEMVDFGLIADKAQWRNRVKFEEQRMKFKEQFGV